MTVHAIDPGHETFRRVRSGLANEVRQCLRAYEDTAVGYALVVWDGRGSAISAFHTSDGPVADDMLPSYVRDVLLRHVTIELAERRQERNT